MSQGKQIGHVMWGRICSGPCCRTGDALVPFLRRQVKRREARAWRREEVATAQ